ncbi:ornithine carbamoyltransferase [bacterium]|nr:ornithine carbamoyltransferase [bacterium]MBU3955068.1 ornithine carbamoyltransferase [bacterium]
MAKSKMFGKDVVTTQELSIEEIEQILSLAVKMKANRYGAPYNSLLAFKTFIMFFYNPSLRTRQSFEAAATELGGHAQFIEPKAMRLKSVKKGVEVAGETIHDAAKVMARFAVGIGIRILETSVDNYGDGNKILREYAKYADVPIINMADDIYHPCQGLADVMGMREHNNNQSTKGKTIVQTWAKGALARSYCSVHESLLLNSRLGVNVKLAYPDDNYALPENIVEQAKKNAEAAGGTFEIVKGDPRAAYKGADYVYSRNWFGKDFYEIGKEAEIKRASNDKYKDWICDEEKMKTANPGAKFIHPMPVDEGAEVTREINQGPRSIVLDIAENRLHVQKAIMALTMSDKL